MLFYKNESFMQELSILFFSVFQITIAIFKVIIQHVKYALLIFVFKE